MTEREIRCDECKAVVMILAKGSKVKPNIYTAHEVCPTEAVSEKVQGFTDAEILNLFGMGSK
jgi:hypothetical protein|tara:strand:- start:617 stop:802 length:186 start_codon:yes stop_codon:yes gene_type:complete